jgi:sugar phosphate isomerase/epimerase
MGGIGFSTGSVAKSDIDRALRLLRAHDTAAVELSALRTHELAPLVRAIPYLDLDGYEHVSVHAPSAFSAADESGIAAALLPLALRGWLIIVHPDTLHNHGLWRAFGHRLAIENMDRRKPAGRTVHELWPVFHQLPEASFCLDLAHAFQCDATLGEAGRLLSSFGGRLAEVHVSEIDSQSRHVRLTQAGISAYQALGELIPLHVPAIIEAPVQPHEIAAELEASLVALGRLVPCAA